MSPPFLHFRPLATPLTRISEFIFIDTHEDLAQYHAHTSVTRTFERVILLFEHCGKWYGHRKHNVTRRHEPETVFKVYGALICVSFSALINFETSSQSSVDIRCHVRDQSHRTSLISTFLYHKSNMPNFHSYRCF
ncbi:Protein of unknown function [Pyronema omphalodes CBS 100304]|uniref:Uncharacterized protein n=1 Tax=Pyronema omphalodes (strain CBS 100304) TaxID=1076935 RepID=U4LAW2_PYROM|nr:Protein of unknown function [Pyronema omphalodes CBS 100304]